MTKLKEIRKKYEDANYMNEKELHKDFMWLLRYGEKASKALHAAKMGIGYELEMKREGNPFGTSNLVKTCKDIEYIMSALEEHAPECGGRG